MTEFSNLIQKYLLRLHACIDKEHETKRINIGSASDLLSTINQAFHTYAVKEHLKAGICSHVFNENYGLLIFLRAILLNGTEIKGIKVQAFKFLDDFIDLMGKAMIRHGPIVKDVCIMYLKQEAAANVKTSALVTLSKILELCHTQNDTDSMGVKKIIEDLYLQLSLGSKLPATVKESVLCLLGVVAHYYPQVFIAYSDRMLMVFLQEMKKQMNCKTRKVDLNVVTGCLLGLKEYLYNFTVSYTEDMDKSYQIFDCVKRAMLAETKNYAISKAALQLLSTHASQFSFFLYENYDTLYDVMRGFMNSINREMQKIGMVAAVALLRQIADLLPEKIEENRSFAVSVFNFFIEDFKKTFVEKSSNKHLNVAAQGYGLFSGACKLLLEKAEVTRMLSHIIQRCEYLFFSDVSNLEEVITLLPAFLEALASIVTQVEHIPDTLMTSFEKLVVYQIENFPKVPSTHRFLVVQALLKVFLALQPKTDLFHGFLSHIVYQGLVRTFSHPLVADIEDYKDRKNQDFVIENPRVTTVTYKNYLYLWISLLDVVKLKEFNAIGISLLDRQNLRESLYDEIIKSILSLYQKLDLATSNQHYQNGGMDVDEDASPDSSSDVLHGIKPNNVNDCRIFVNLVDFCREFLIDNSVDLFKKWVYTFGRQTIYYSTKYPFISGFYKIVALIFNICTEIKYFKEIAFSIEDSDSLGETKKKKEYECCFHLFSKFSREVVVYIQHFKDDLLASCLLVILALPTEIIQQELHILIPALQNTLKLGLSYLPLASIGLKTLKRWSQELPHEEMKKYYPTVLPLLNQYLVTPELKGEKLTNAITSKSLTKKSHKISAKYVKAPTKVTPEMVEESELKKLQLEIVNFLGCLGGEFNKGMLEHAFEKAEEAAIAWDFGNRQHLKYSIPFIDMKPDIYFDDFLPRVLELATTSGDRQIKVAACEVLHSMVLYIIGRGSQLPEKHEQKLSMEELYRHLMPGLLQLACDVDQVVKQLFQPLVFQLTHWFTHRKTISTPESQVILLSLWDGATHQENAALRDFSALCLKEYFQWMIKQSLQESDRSLKNFFKKMYSFAIHPSPSKRLGAALVFNNIYMIFRNHEKLVKQFTLELLVEFVESLAIAHDDDKFLGTQKLCLEALDHIMKILFVKASWFVTPSRTCRKPMCLEEADFKSVVSWLFVQCGSIQMECRHKCMELFLKFVSLVPGISHPSGFIKTFMTDEVTAMKIFNQRLFELGVPPIKAMKASCKRPITWMESLMCSLECHNWCLIQEMLQEDQETQLVSSKLYEALEFFVREVVRKDLPSVLSNFVVNDVEEKTFSPKEILEYNWTKCTVLVRIFTLLISLDSRPRNVLSRTLNQRLWKKEFWEVILLAVIDPTSLGFDTTDVNVSTNLATEMLSVMQMKKCQEKEFIDFCNEFVNSNEKYCLDSYRPINLNALDIDHVQLCELMSGLTLLTKANVWLSERASSSTKDKIAKELVNNVWNSFSENSTAVQSNLGPLTQQLARAMLKLSDSLHIQEEFLVSKLLDAYPLQSSCTSEEVIKRGPVIYSFFEGELSEIMCRSISQYMSVLTSELNGRRSSDSMSLITKFLNAVSTSKHLQKHYGTQVLEAVLDNWLTFHSCCEDHSDDKGLDSALSLLTSILLLDSKAGSKHSSLHRTYTLLLKTSKKTLDFKVHVLDLLPFFLEGSNTSSLRNTLDTLIATYFPLDSKELLVGSSNYNTYSSAIKKFLTALDLTGSTLLIEILSVLFCKEESHFLMPAFEKCLNSLIRRLPAHRHQEVVEETYKLTRPEGNELPVELQFEIMERVCLTLLRRMSLSAFSNFYIQNIKYIMNILMQKKSYVLETRQVQLVAKINSFKLLELLYSRLHKEQLHTIESQIVHAYVGGKPQAGKELTTDIIKTALEFKKENVELEETLVDLTRKLCCASFNALVAVVSCTQTDIKFYNAFIFKENILKGEKIWEAIVDPGKIYSFNIEHDETISRKKQFVSIRHSLRHGGDDNGDNNDDDKEVESSLHMMASQYLAMSSLADDVSKFDFSTTQQVLSSKKNDSFSTESGSVSETVDLEDDALNMHECMAPMSFLFQHMFRNNLISEDSGTYPNWLDAFVANLENQDANKNVKLFLARVIINNSKIFKVYGRYLLKPLMNFIASGTMGAELNYFILDIVLAMLSWAPDAIPENDPIQRHNASSFLEFLVRRCSHSRRDIFRNNLEIIKTLIECWKGRFDVPYDAIYEQMKSTEPPTKESLVGIQLLGVVLSSGMPAFTVGCENEELMRLNLLTGNLRNKYKEVYASAAEVIGLIFKSKVEGNQSLEGDFFYGKVIDRLMSLRDAEVDKFLVCLHTIHRHYPRISCRFYPKLMYIQPSVHGVYQTYVLDLLCSCVLEVDNGYSQLKSIGIFEDIEHKEEAWQHILLEAIGKVCLSLPSGEILHLLPIVTPVCHQPVVRCRLALFKILMSLFDKYRHDDGAKEKEIVRISQETLLKALADTDLSLRLTVDNFWSSEERLPVGTKDRLLALMKNMYSPPTEDAFLQYATFLLLERTSHSPDYKRKIFEHPLSECNFLAYNISTSWRQRYAAMTPMFVDSMSSSLASSTLDATNISTLGNNDDLVRATQEPGGDFSATHNTVTRTSTFNWLTNKSIDTFQDVDPSLDELSTSDSANKSHLFTVKTRKAAIPPKQMSRGHPAEKNRKDEKEKSSVWLLKRRFIKDRSSQSDVFARIELRKKDVREELQQEQKKRREAEVTMYRQYRIGELPDIEIPNSAMIAPLQALAQHDAFVAKLLFKSLVVSMCQYVEEEEPETCSGFTDEICRNLCQILQKSTSFVPAVISFCLESLHHFDGRIVDSEDIFVSSLKSNQQSLGILLLESKILKSLEIADEPKKKKVKKSPNVIPEPTAQWIKLAGLHRSIYDYDTCNGIFSKVFGMEKPKNQEALALETQGHYSEALRLYEEMYEDAKEETDQAEKDFLDNSLLFCYDRLTEWQKLDSISVSRFTEPENVDLLRLWEEPYFIDNYLPYVMRSKGKCLIEGVGDQSLLSFVDASCVDEDRKSYLEEHFVEELALLYIIQEKFDSAEHYSSLCLQRFLKEWKNLSSLAIGVQQSKLRCLQKYIELGEFLDLVRRDKFDNPCEVRKQVKIWENRLPSNTDPPDIWDDVVSNRQLFLRKLEIKCSNIRGVGRQKPDDLSIIESEPMEVDDEDEISKFFMEQSMLQKLAFANYSAIKNNIPAALRHLKTVLKEIRRNGESLWPNFISTYCITNHRKAERLHGNEKLESLLSSWSQLDKMAAKCSLNPSQKALQSQCLESMAEMFANREIRLSELKSTNRDKMREIVESDLEKEVIHNMHQQSFSVLKSAVSDVQQTRCEDKSKPIDEAFLSLANFCNKYLRMVESDTNDCFGLADTKELGEYPKLLVESLLSALRHGNKQASQLFPRLLQVIELYKDVMPLFIRKVEDIPCWMFLGWVNQLVALLDKAEGHAVHSIVQSICHNYPNAIVYAFRLSSENYDFTMDTTGKKNKVFVDSMKSILDGNTLISSFISALHHLSVPLLIFKDYMLGLLRLLGPSERNINEIQQLFNEMWKELFDLSDTDASRSSVGPIQRKFDKVYSAEVLKVCGKEGENLFSKNAKVASNEFKSLYEKMRNSDVVFRKSGSSLASFSTWLSEFRAWKYGAEIEVPGQYTGTSKPMTEYHVKIAGFDEKVLVLSSMTQPRRITIRGNDEKEYKILVKAGEDLRQDSRIQQLFLLMNDIYQNDPECGKRHLKLATYKVIPLSSRLGIIEWVDNTIVLNEFLCNAMTVAESKRYETSSGYNNIGHAKIAKLAPSKEGPTKMYKLLHEKKERDICIKTYEEIVAEVPTGLLKRSFLKLSSSLEAYMRLRNQFSVSHAVLCISQWLLGIGDRHLGNFLIDTKSGQEIGIDFGHAFGSATQFLQVPELVPFRLTPQYLQLMSPLRERGILKATMIHALAALRRNDYLLLNVMDIFIKEPTLDWKTNATKQQQAMGMTDEEIRVDADWYPKQRVEIALKKLHGANPCHIMRKELLLGHGGDPLFEKMQAVCVGHPDYNLRAQLPSNGLTVEQQVNCLIDQATDPHILCKTYFGWNPWM